MGKKPFPAEFKSLLEIRYALPGIFDLGDARFGAVRFLVLTYSSGMDFYLDFYIKDTVEDFNWIHFERLFSRTL